MKFPDLNFVRGTKSYRKDRFMSMTYEHRPFAELGRHLTALRGE
jgi:hypothetical protein